MAKKLTGLAVVFAFPGTVAFSGAGTFIKDSGDLEHNYQLDEITDDDNELVTLIHSKEVYDFTFLFTPTAAAGTPQALSSARASLVPPAKGAAVTLSGFDAGAGGADIVNKADWCYIGGWKLAYKKNGVCTYAMKIRRSPNKDISLAVA